MWRGPARSASLPAALATPGALDSMRGVFYIEGGMTPPGDVGASVASPDTAVTESMRSLKDDIKSSIRDSVAAAEVHEHPYRHWFLTDVFPQGVYQSLKTMPFRV